MRSRLRAAAGVIFRRLKSAPLSGASYIASLSPAAWYRYGQGITSSGGLVSAWADQSGNSRHLLQATGTNQPTVSADGTITFDGLDNFMRAIFTFNQPITAYCVYNPIVASMGMRILGGATNGTNFSYLRWNASGGQIAIACPTVDATLITTAGTWVADVAVVNGASSIHARFAGASVTGSPGANNAGGITVAADQATTASNFSNTAYREIILFSGVHDEATRNRVLIYLATLL